MTKSAVEPRSADSRLADLASGQRLVIFAILVNIASIPIVFVSRPFGTICGLVGTVLGIVGIVRLAAGLGRGTILRVLFVLLMLIPLVNVLTLAMLNARATRRLRAGGYQVGFLGATEPDARGSAETLLPLGQEKEHIPHMRRFEVKPNASQWGVTDGANVVATAGTKAEAVKLAAQKARAAASPERPTQLFVRGKDGRIQEERTYPRSADPRSSKR